MLKSFKIYGLYGLFSYELSFKKGVFIISGPNGFGKTTILRCIDSIYSGDFWSFFFLKFDYINLEFDDDKRLELQRTVNNKNVLFGESKREVTVRLIFFGNDNNESFLINQHYISRLIRYQTRRDPSDPEEFLESNYSLFEDEMIQNAMPKLLEYLHGKNCIFVGSQRLIYGRLDYRGNQTGIAYTIDDVNEQIKKTYLNAHNAFSKKAQTIDGTFIERLSKSINTQESLKQKVSASELQKQITKYRKYHIVEEMNVEVQLPESFNVVKDMYLADIQSKLASLEAYYEQLSTFDGFVTGQGLSYKRIELNESGIKVLSDVDDDIPLKRLSSGEQNLMILAYHLIFETSENDVLLVDEPENSLHMSWLENLLEEYIRIAKLSGIQVIIATHSPTFIGSRYKMVYDLFDNNKVD